MLTYFWPVPHFAQLMAIGLLVLVCGLSNGAQALSLHSPAIMQGEIYRLYLGQFCHTNWVHALLNLAGTYLILLLHGHHYSVKSWWLMWLLLLTLTGAALTLLGGHDYYVGLSGMLHGLFLFGAMRDIQSGDKTGWLLLLGLTLKILHEQYFGPSDALSALINANVATHSHLYGALGGLFIALGYLLIKRRWYSAT